MKTNVLVAICLLVGMPSMTRAERPDWYQKFPRWEHSSGLDVVFRKPVFWQTVEPIYNIARESGWFDYESYKAGGGKLAAAIAFDLKQTEENQAVCQWWILHVYPKWSDASFNRNTVFTVKTADGWTWKTTRLLFTDHYQEQRKIWEAGQGAEGGYSSVPLNSTALQSDSDGDERWVLVWARFEPVSGPEGTDPPERVNREKVVSFSGRGIVTSDLRGGS